MKYFDGKTLGIVAITAFGVVGGLWTISGVVAESWTKSNAPILLTHSFYWVIIPMISYLSFCYKRQAGRFISPSVKIVLEDGLLLLEPCDWLSYGTLVTVYKSENEVETIVGLGAVVNIQENKMPQIKLQGVEAKDVDMLKSAREKLKIKPGLNENV